MLAIREPKTHPQCSSMLLELPDVLLGEVARQLLLQWAVSSLRALFVSCTQLDESDALRAVLCDPDFLCVERRLTDFLAKAGKCERELWKTTKICRPLKSLNAGDLEVAGRLSAMGALAQLRKLILGANQIGDAGLAALCQNVPRGALGNLSELWLGGTNIGDEGMVALANAIRGGKLPSVAVLSLATNEIGDAGAVAFGAVLADGAMPHLGELYLHDNKIGDAGMLSLARALRGGGLPALRELSLGGNPGDKAPINACRWE